MSNSELKKGVVKLLLDWVLVIPDAPVMETGSGIIMPSPDTFDVVKGVVVDVGPGIPFPKDIGIRKPIVKPGDKIAFSKARADWLKICNVNCCILSERLVYCIIGDDQVYDSIQEPNTDYGMERPK